MTARQRISLDDKLKEFDEVLTRNGGIHRQQNWNLTKENAVSPNYQTYSHKTCEKEKKVKEIEDRINNIMKKHEDGGQDQSRTMPLTPINKYLNEYQKGNTFLGTAQPLSASSNQRAFSEFRRVKGAVGNGQTKKINQRSFNVASNCTVTKEKQRYLEDCTSESHNKYDSKIYELNLRIKRAEQNKKKLNIDFQPFCPAKNQEKGQYQQITRSIHTSVKKQKSVDLHKLQQSQPNVKLSQNHSKIIEPFHLPKPSSILSQIAALFCEQIKMDENLRNLKSWITLSNDPNKWKALHAQLLKRNIAMTMEQCRQTFSSTAHEHCPFFKSDSKGSSTGVTQLIDAYELSESFWKKQMFRKWKRSQLQPQQLEKALLMNQKREIQLEDLVRFVNMQASTFYRNRDMFLVFNRLARKGSSTLSITKFIQSLTIP